MHGIFWPKFKTKQTNKKPIQLQSLPFISRAPEVAPGRLFKSPCPSEWLLALGLKGTCKSGHV